MTRGKLILASRSPRRARLLRALGVPFRALEMRCRETAPPLSAENTARLLAWRKVMAAARKVRSERRILLAADTVVALGRSRLGKPRSRREARRQLRRLAGRTHEVCTAVALLETGTGRGAIGAARSRVTMRGVSRAEIRRYVATGEPMDKAGSYAIQGGAGRFVTRVRGDFYAVVGLPLRLLARLARRFGIRIPPSRVAALYARAPRFPRGVQRDRRG